MACCCVGDVEITRENLSPIENRKCTDVLFVPLFIAALIGSLVLTGIAADQGDLNVLKYGITTSGQLCGQGNMSSRPEQLFCVVPADFWALDFTPTIFSTCVETCPTTSDDLVPVWSYAQDEFEEYHPNVPWTTSDYTALKEFCVSPTKPLLHRCVYDISIENVTSLYNETLLGDPADSELSSSRQMLLNGFNDVYVTSYIILCMGILLSLAIAFVWFQLLRCFTNFLVWTSILLVFVALVVVDVVLYQSWQGEYDNISAETSAEYEKYFQYMFYIALGFTIAFFLLLVFLFNRIRLAIALIKEATDVFWKMPALLLTPIMPLLALGLVFAYFMFVSVLLASCGDIVEGHLEYSKDLRYALVYHVAFCLWWAFVIQAMHTTIMAGAIASFYFTRDKGSLSRPIRAALGRTIRYHMGSLIFGSLILTIIRLIRWWVMYMSEQAKKQWGDNPLVKFVLCCVNCYLKCVEKCVQYLTKNAYIMVAVDGRSFCASGMEAWSLITSNMVRMATVNFVSSYVFFLSKIGVSAFAALFGFAAINNRYNGEDGNNEVTSPFVPCILIFFLAYASCGPFFEVADFTIDTLLLCFCLDDREHRQAGNYYASERLVQFMNTTSKPLKRTASVPNAPDGGDL